MSKSKGNDGKKKFYRALKLDRNTKKFLSQYQKLSRTLQNETK